MDLAEGFWYDHTVLEQVTCWQVFSIISEILSDIFLGFASYRKLSNRFNKLSSMLQKVARIAKSLGIFNLFRGLSCSLCSLKIGASVRGPTFIKEVILQTEGCRAYIYGLAHSEGLLFNFPKGKSWINLFWQRANSCRMKRV